MMGRTHSKLDSVLLREAESPSLHCGRGEAGHGDLVVVVDVVVSSSSVHDHEDHAVVDAFDFVLSCLGPSI